MRFFNNKLVKLVVLVVCLVPLLSVAKQEELPKPEHITIDHSLSKAKIKALIKVARTFYAFWNTGKESFAKQSIAENFVDHMLPKGRPQGPTGPLFASKNFRQAVPDLNCAIADLVVTQDRVVARLKFSGHFTGTFMDKVGKGQAVHFDAIDILRIQNGKVTDNWHLEDNLSLMQQLGIVSKL